MMPDTPVEPCTPNPVQGVVLEAAPSIELHAGAVYVPLRHTVPDTDPDWGLYAGDGTLIEAAAYRRGPGNALVGQSPARQDRSAPEAPDPCLIYGGVFVDHFGHFLLTSIARLWPLVQPGSLDLSRYRILVHAPFGLERWFAVPYVHALLGALGLPLDRFVTFAEPTRIPQVVVPRPALQEQSHVHREYLALTQRIGQALAAPPTTERRPAWLSRSQLSVGTQGFENESAVEAVLERFGVECVHPEAMGLADQIALFAHRPVLAGSIGSAFHLAAFCPFPAPAVLLSPSPTPGSNFAMLDRLTGQRTRYLHAPAEHLGIDMKRRIWSLFRLPRPEAVAAAVLRAMQGLAAGDGRPPAV